MERQKDWWKQAVLYQIYPRSFKDSNHDGIGDLQGIISKLDYLEKLGVDAVWLSPVYCSPQADNGYDISDYQDIDPVFGTIEDMEELIAEGKKRNIGFVMDLVLNHTSDEHYWFLEAKKSKDNPYHDYYVWRDGKEGVPPNDLTAAFGGSAWEWVPELGQYYFHQFAVKQPDLNWENEKVRKEIYQMIRWWMDKGVVGFRMDVIDLIAKEPDRKICTNGPKLHEFIKEMAGETFFGKNLVTVGEAWSCDVEKAKIYSNPDGSELSMVFQFEHILLDQEGEEKWDLKPLSLVELKKVFQRWQNGLEGKGWNSLFWDNHDLPRIVSRWGNDKEYRVESAKMLALVLHGMQGTPYIYQGEELGMTNARFPIEEYRDIELPNMYQKRIEKGYKKEDIMESIYAKGRDNARTPMQWDDSANAGFTDGKPWIKVNPNYQEINARNALSDENSVFYWYQSLIRFRKKYPVFKDGKFILHALSDEDLFVYERVSEKEKLLVAANFHGQTVPFAFPAGWTGEEELLMHNYDSVMEEGTLRPYEAVLYYTDNR